MFGFDMTEMVKHIEGFKGQSERAVKAIEEVQRDIALIKKHLGIQEETPAIEQEAE